MTRGKKILVIYTVFSALCLIGALLCFFTIGKISDSVPSQHASERWEKKDMRCTQVSCFLSPETGLSPDGLYSIRSQINSSVNESGALSASGARAWYDAYSAETDAYVCAKDSDTGVSARVFLTGGDYFMVHQMKFMSGYFYSDGSVMDDGVVISKALAWKLFGGYELEGMTVSINGIRCQVVGVTEAPLGSAEEEEYGEENSIYIPYSLWQRNGYSVSITCYEVVLPNPVKNFGVDAVKNALGFSEGEAEYVENRGRYGFLRNLSTLSSFDTLVMRENRIFFPYWENAARAAQSRTALITLLALCLLVFPTADVIVFAVILYGKRHVLANKIKRRKYKL